MIYLTNQENKEETLLFSLKQFNENFFTLFNLLSIISVLLPITIMQVNIYLIFTIIGLILSSFLIISFKEPNKISCYVNIVLTIIELFVGGIGNYFNDFGLWFIIILITSIIPLCVTSFYLYFGINFMPRYVVLIFTNLYICLLSIFIIIYSENLSVLFFILLSIIVLQIIYFFIFYRNLSLIFYRILLGIILSFIFTICLFSILVLQNISLFSVSLVELFFVIHLSIKK
jgi:hypothetical protein